MSMMELGNRIDDADIPEALTILSKHPSMEARNMISQRLIARWIRTATAAFQADRDVRHEPQPPILQPVGAGRRD